MTGEKCLGRAADPATRTCDWCEKPGVKAIELKLNAKVVGLGRFLYPCSDHVRTAERAAAEFASPKQRAA